MSDPVLLGLDPSPSNIGWATVHADTGTPIATGRVEVTTTGWIHRHIHHAIRLIVADVWPDSINAWTREEPMSRFPQQVKGHGYVAACVDAACDHAYGISHATNLAVVDDRPCGLKPGEWRRLIDLPGNAPKDAVLRWARASALPHGLLVETQDEADALAIATAAWRQLQDRDDQEEAA